MITARETAKKICQNGSFLLKQNSKGFREEKKPIVPPLPGYFTWVESDKESSPVVGKILRSGA